MNGTEYLKYREANVHKYYQGVHEGWVAQNMGISLEDDTDQVRLFPIS